MQCSPWVLYQYELYIDSWLGTLIATLSESGLDDSTLIIFTSDHGDMLGDRRHLVQDVFL